MSATKPLILILCTGNSCRSHLAEGILRAVAGDVIEVTSAGSKPAGYVHPLALQVMREIDIDISKHRSKHLSEFLDCPVDTVITVCGNADQACPIFPGQVNRHHWPFERSRPCSRLRRGEARGVPAGAKRDSPRLHRLRRGTARRSEIGRQGPSGLAITR